MEGFGLDVKLVLHLQVKCLNESLKFLSRALLQIAKRDHNIVSYNFIPS